MMNRRGIARSGGKGLPIVTKRRCLSPRKPAPQPMPLEPERLKPVLHEKIERMDCEHLNLVNRLLLQLEAEERPSGF